MRWFLNGLLAGVVTLGGMYRAEAAQRLDARSTGTSGQSPR